MGGTLGVFGRAVLVACAVGAASVAAGQSQWTATVLTPQNAFFEQRAYATAGGVQVGQANGQAALWSGNAASYVNLAPTGAYASVAFGTDGVHQVGYTQASAGSIVPVRAVMWSGNASSMVDLTPAGYESALASAVQGGQQVGNARVSMSSNRIVAALWSGSAQSFVNLTPNDDGSAIAVYGGRQAGQVLPSGGASRAALWSGTAESRVDLHPSGFTSSVVLGMDATQQVGYAVRPGGLTVAGVWSGSAESFVSLQPAGVLDSRANAVFSEYQVGVANNAPAIWNGTAQSMEFLPFPAGIPRFRGEASGVWADATTLYVSGWIEDLNFNQLSKAVLWTRPIPTPGSLAVLALAGVVSVRRRR